MYLAQKGSLMTTALFEQALTLAHQLTMGQKARLIATLAAELADTIPITAEADEAWVRLEAFRHDMESLGPDAPNFGAALDADRRTRQTTLEGEPHVHA